VCARRKSLCTGAFVPSSRFFFQAEDGIRVFHVTGVQTCALPIFSVSPDSTRCSTCMLSEICLPLGMARNDVSRLDELIKERIRLPKGTALFHLGDKTEAVYGIRSGSIKTQLEDASGQVQITGFLLPGEILGMDGLVDNTHVSHAIALEDS